MGGVVSQSFLLLALQLGRLTMLFADKLPAAVELGGAAVSGSVLITAGEKSSHCDPMNGRNDANTDQSFGRESSPLSEMIT